MKNFLNSAAPYIIAIFLLCATGETYHLYLKEVQKTKRLLENLTAVQQQNEYFVSRNGDQAVKIKSQELTIQELRKTLPDVMKDLRNVYIRPQQLENYASSTNEIKKEIITTVRDSIIRDTVRISIIDYTDKWFSVKGKIEEHQAKLQIHSTDTITVINYLSRRPHRWLWFLGGRRHPEAIITNKNPFTRIAVQKSINIK